MWIFLEQGLYSATCPNLPNGTRDDGTIQIRARLRAHLPALIKAFPAVFDAIENPPKIEEDSGTDYRFRIFITRAKFAQLMAEVALSNHAHNFKNTVAKRWGHDSAYCRMLHGAWHLHYEMQEAERAAERGGSPPRRHVARRH